MARYDGSAALIYKSFQDHTSLFRDDCSLMCAFSNRTLLIGGSHIEEDFLTIDLSDLDFAGNLSSFRGRGEMLDFQSLSLPPDSGPGDPHR